MSNLINLNKRQKLYILTGSIISFFLFIASIAMFFNYKRLEDTILYGQKLQLTIWTMVGWCLLMYFAYALTSCLLECTWIQSVTSISVSDVTLELTEIKVRSTHLTNLVFFKK
jgi:hypothetical protein